MWTEGIREKGVQENTWTEEEAKCHGVWEKYGMTLEPRSPKIDKHAIVRSVCVFDIVWTVYHFAIYL